MHDGGLEPSAVERDCAHSGIRVVTVYMNRHTCVVRRADLWVTLLATNSLYLHTDSHPTRGPYRLYTKLYGYGSTPLPQHH
jgi:hypothetical protein